MPSWDSRPVSKRDTRRFRKSEEKYLRELSHAKSLASDRRREAERQRVHERHLARQRKIIATPQADKPKGGCAVTAVGLGLGLLAGAARLRGWM